MTERFDIDAGHRANRWVGRMWRTMGIVALVAGWVPYFIGIGSLVTAIIWTVGFCIPVITLVAWSWDRSFAGHIDIDETGIALRRRGNEFLIRWDDVESVRLGALGDTAVERSPLGWALGLSHGDKLVRVRLKRMIRKHLLRGRFSTRGLGIPSFTQDMVLAPTDPYGLIASLDEHISRYQTGAPEADPIT